MQNSIAKPNRKTIIWTMTLFIGWLLLWFAPWQGLSSIPMFLKLGIALIVFIVPGFCIYGLIQAESSSWLNHLTFGFVISHLILAVFGTLGRLLHFPFALLKHGMLALALILLLWYAIPKLISFELPRFEISTIKNIFSALPLVLMIILAGLMTIQRVLSDDDLTYLALLTNWQRSSALNFNDVFFGADKYLSVRFWIVSTPFSQAFLSDLSGLPGIFVLGGYYEPFLAALALICIYELAQTLGLSRFKATAAVAFQLICLALLAEYLHPGAPFFRQLSTDKATATFIVIPVFLQSIVWYLREPIKKNILLVTLTGLSLMLMHPIALVYAVMVAGLITVFGLNQTNLRARIGLLILLVLIMSPQIALRFVKSEAQAVIPFSVEDTLTSGGIESMISVWGSTKFYGYNPTILAMRIPYADKLPIPAILQFAWLIFPIFGAAFALKRIRHDPLSQYVLAGFLLGALAGIPFTGWLLGSLVSAWMLERSLWLYPFGIGMVFVLTTLGEAPGLTNHLTKWLRPLQTKTKIDPAHWLLATLTVFSAAALLLIMREQSLPDLARFESNASRYKEFTQIGNFMDEHTLGQTFAVGTDRYNDFIPAITSKVKLISYRPSDASYPYFYSLEERSQRFQDRQSIFSRDVTNEERIVLIRKYAIRFLWLKGGEYYMVKNLIVTNPDIFIEHKFEGYYLIEVR
ncbi:MAG: hypothetical protein ABI904_12180 [Chloroflexota bacterium]